MTYRELIDKANKQLENNKITLGEYEEMTKPLDQEILKVGKWIEEHDDYGKLTGWHCSNCYDKTGFVTTCAWDYCTSCGAEMRGKEND